MSRIVSGMLQCRWQRGLSWTQGEGTEELRQGITKTWEIESGSIGEVNKGLHLRMWH